jgi:hypothetical protein
MEMAETKIYEITVYGHTSHVPVDVPNVKDFLYPIKFYITSCLGEYKVYVKVGSYTVNCGFFDSDIFAKKYISDSMKMAMKGKFVYRICLMCGKKNYYPSIICELCKSFNYNRWNVEDTENENEKNFENLPSFLKNGAKSRIELSICDTKREKFTSV